MSLHLQLVSVPCSNLKRNCFITLRPGCHPHPVGCSCKNIQLKGILQKASIERKVAFESSN
jgi:hypothetical protein